MTRGLSKILFSFFQTAYASDGGVHSALELLNHFAAVTPLVITQRESLLISGLKEQAVDITVLPVAREPGKSLLTNGLIQASLDLWRIVSTNCWVFWQAKRQKASALHCNDVLAFLYCGLGGKLAGIKVVSVLRRSFEAGRRYSKKYQLMFCWSDFVVVLSEEMKSQLLERFGPTSNLAKKIVVIPSGVDRHRYFEVDEDEKHSIQSDLGLEPNMFHVGYVGSFTPRKGQLDVLKNICLPLANEQGMHFHFLGDVEGKNNSYAKKCTEFVANNKISQVASFHGAIAQIVNWYRACDVMMLASQSEGLARAMIEALSVGVPVVSFDVTSAAEILKQFECGIVVRQGDYEGLKRALLELKEDAELRRRYRNNALRVAADYFDSNKAANRFEELYLDS